MHDKQLLFQLLNQSGFHSGTWLGEKLGISRVTIQKRIQSLVELGLPIHVVQGKGYKLADGVRLLDADEIKNKLTAQGGLVAVDQLEVLLSTRSTNTHLIEQSAALGKAKVCLTEIQEKGRGRRGNEWVAAPFQNILMSLSWGFPAWPEAISGLSLAVSLVVAERLNKTFGINAQIKWPNDILVGQRKLAGILVDVAGESGGACNVVIGLGLNVKQAEEQPFQADYAWQDLSSLGVNVDRNELAAAIVSDLVGMLSVFEQNGFAPLVERWHQLSCFNGQGVSVNSVDEKIVGTMLGVDSFGALLVEDEAGVEHRFTDSSVSVRPV